LGTAGSLSLVNKNEFKFPLILTNSDLISNINYKRLLNFHIKNKSDLTICVRNQIFEMPYGEIYLEGKKVLKIIEKPISNSSKDVLKLINKCKLKKSILMVGYNLRFLESLKKFREILKKDKIGKIISIRSEVGSYLPSWRPNIDYKKSVSATKKLGGGVLLELSHDIDYLVWLFGNVKWVNSKIDKRSNLKINTEDTAHITLCLSGKNKKNNIIANLNMDFYRHDITRFCKAIGQNGTLYWNAIDCSVKLFKKGAKQWKIIHKNKFHRDTSYISEWKHFINCIKNNKKPLIDGKDGFEVIKIIEAIKKSSDSSSTVSLA